MTGSSLTNNIEIKGENPERDKQKIDKINKITKGPPLKNRKVNLHFEKTRLKEIKNFIKPSGKVDIGQQRSVLALVPRSTVHKHYNSGRIFGLKEINFEGNEKFNFGNKARNIKKLNNIEKYLTNTKLGIKFKSGKQASCANTYFTKGKTKQGNTNWYEENKLKKLIVLNYTERGKQQEL